MESETIEEKIRRRHYRTTTTVEPRPALARQLARGDHAPVDQEIRVVPQTGWTASDFDAWVADQRWSFAHSMPFLPHEYTLRKRAPEFAEAVAFADRAGRHALWPSVKRHSLRSYYVSGDHMYWHMNPPGRSDLAEVFNRCRIDPETGVALVKGNRVVWLDELPEAERSIATG